MINNDSRKSMEKIIYLIDYRWQVQEAENSVNLTIPSSGQCAKFKVLTLIIQLKRSNMLLNLHCIKNVIFLSALLTICLPLASIAQWTVLDAGTIETLNEIVFPIPDTGFVVGANGTLLRTLDGGITGLHTP
jgi:hypothetical protein